MQICISEVILFARVTYINFFGTKPLPNSLSNESLGTNMSEILINHDMHSKKCLWKSGLKISFI